LVKRVFDMHCERALSRNTFHGTLADNAVVKAQIAESWMQIEQFRLLVLHAAWQMDVNGAIAAMPYVSACKVAMARVGHDVVERAIHLHGALGASNETPLARLWQVVPTLALMDGPSEVHQDVIARRALADHSPAPGNWPTQFLPELTAKARERYAQLEPAI
jgi:acyl-CoA dehydrogenase